MPTFYLTLFPTTPSSWRIGHWPWGGQMGKPVSTQFLAGLWAPDAAAPHSWSAEPAEPPPPQAIYIGIVLWLPTWGGQQQKQAPQVQTRIMPPPTWVDGCCRVGAATGSYCVDVLGLFLFSTVVSKVRGRGLVVSVPMAGSGAVAFATTTSFSLLLFPPRQVSCMTGKEGTVVLWPTTLSLSIYIRKFISMRWKKRRL